MAIGRRVRGQVPGYLEGIWVEQEFGRVVPIANTRIPGSVDAEAVVGSRADLVDLQREVMTIRALHLEPAFAVVEEAELDCFRSLGSKAELRR
jgi:hypothetical protein